MALEIDHIYSFCDPALNEVPLLERQGLTLNEGRVHQGQGTANRCVVFDENYFELIFVTSEKEARENILRLDRRANWRSSGASPFGIALRGQIAEEDRAQFWAYHPPYASDVVIWIHEANEKQPALPMIFFMEFSKPRVRAPRMTPYSLGPTRIESVIAFAPGARWPLAEKVESVRFESAPRPHLHLHLDGNKETNFAINELCSFAVSRISCLGVGRREA